jgi:hypothetical protein
MARKRPNERVFLVMTNVTPGGWGKARTVEQALSFIKGEWGAAFLKQWGYTVYEVDKKTWVDGMACLVYPRDCPPKLIKQVDGTKLIGGMRQAEKKMPQRDAAPAEAK